MSLDEFEECKKKLKKDYLVIEFKKGEEDPSEIPETLIVKHGHRF